MLQKVIFFLVLNFGALAIGSYFTEAGATSDWYQNLEKAPWSPPGWMFGAAWTIIMIFFSIYMAHLLIAQRYVNKIIALYSIQWILNTAWNAIFFKFQMVFLGFMEILLLTGLIAYLFLNYWSTLKTKSIFILPYLMWLIIASYFNGYIFLLN